MVEARYVPGMMVRGPFVLRATMSLQFREITLEGSTVHTYGCQFCAFLYLYGSRSRWTNGIRVCAEPILYLPSDYHCGGQASSCTAGGLIRP